MKKYLCALLCVALVFVLTACADDTGKNISPLIDPAEYGSVVPQHAPSTAWPDPDAHQPADPAESATIFTIDMKGELDNDRFIAEEFSFYVPPQWRDHFSMEAELTGSGQFEMRTFNFYYVEQDTGIQVHLFRVDVMPLSFVEQVGDLSKQQLGVSADGQYYYMQSETIIKPPDAFHSGADVMDIYTVVHSEKLDFQVLV